MKIKFIAIVFLLQLSISVFGQTADFDFTDVCIGDTTVLTSISTSAEDDPIVFWGWDLSGNGEFNDATGEEVRFKFSESGIYLIGLRIITELGSSEAIYQNVQVGGIPTANFRVENACANDFTNFIGLSTADEGDNLEDFFWDFGDGGTNTYSENPGHWYVSPGFYTVQLIAQTTLGCSDTIVRTVEINSVPVFDFEYSGDTIFTEGESVIVTAVGEFDDILWSTGSTNSSITITTGGYYFAEVQNQGCPSSNSFTIIVHDRIGVTNLITPNGDGYNDKFEIFHIQNHEPCQVTIFDREGKLVYSSSIYNNRWSGTYNGQPLPEGTYYYIVNCSRNLTQKGALSIIR